MPASSKPILILNGAEARLQAVAAQDGALLACQDWSVPGRAMEFLAPVVDGMLRRLGLTASDLGGVACVRGPGGFTGVRLVMATALGLGLGAGLPMAGLDYLELLAWEPAAVYGRRTAVVTHSRRREVYYQEFAPAGGSVRTVTGIEVLDLAAAAERLAAFCAAGPGVVLGSGLRRNFEALGAALPPEAVLPAGSDNPGPAALIEAASRAHWGMEPFQPVYVRGSDAEENLEAIAAARGIGFEQARRTLSAGASTG